MRICELCGNENPEEARFCMKCGKDMDKVKSSNIPGEMLEDPATFTPVGQDEYSRLAPTARASQAPVGDVASYKEAAAAAAAALQAQQELESAQSAEQDQEKTDDIPDVPSEIDQRSVTADFVARRQFCLRCGMANPYDQRFCKNCGSSLGEARGGMADQSFSAPPSIPATSAPVETTTLADVSPSSAYSNAPDPRPGRAAPPRQRTSSGGGIADWGAREWLGLTVAALVLIAIVWFVFFGGYSMLFNSRNKNIHKAGATMQKLPGFKFQIASTYEVEQGQYGGSGQALFETPDRSAWEVRRETPGNPQVQGTIAVGASTYSGAGGKWQLDDPATSAGDIILMWKKFTQSESLPSEVFAGKTCIHYKYRMNPTLMKTVLGLGNQETVSDAIMEVWIDTTTFQVIHQTAQVFGAQIDGARTKITLVMDLVEVGKPYGIKPPS
ncbi:MAG: zinc ribbon domain-containing protein [Candidatus Geothermincolia bacterium]